MKREDCTSTLREARMRSGLTYQEIADKLGRHAVWTAAALMGQATMDAAEAETVVNLLGLEGGEEAFGEGVVVGVTDRAHRR